MPVEAYVALFCLTFLLGRLAQVFSEEFPDSSLSGLCFGLLPILGFAVGCTIGLLKAWS